MIVYAVIYVESHPDREMTFLGVFSTEEKAQQAADAFQSSEKQRLPQAYIPAPRVIEGELDSSFWQG